MRLQAATASWPCKFWQTCGSANACRYSPLALDCICARCSRAWPTGRNVRKNCPSGSAQPLLESGMGEDSKPFDFIGYRELRAVLRGEMTLEEARAAIQQATRRYAKRQLTWFRKEPGVRWFSGFGDEAAVQAMVIEWLQTETV